MCSEILIVSYWVVDHADRMLALVAIVIAAFAIWDVHKLFTELEKRDKDTESRVRKAVLKELLTFTASVATYSRAAQFIEFYEGQPDRETAVVANEAAALLTDYDRRVRHYEVAQMDGLSFRQS